MARYAFIVMLLAIAAASAKYVTLDDNFSYAELKKHPEILKQHLDCGMDEGPCTPLMESFKVNVPEIIKEACLKCTPDQKRLVREYLEAVKEVFPERFKQYVERRDPTGEYLGKLEQAIAGY